MEREVLVGLPKPESIDQFNLQIISSSPGSKFVWLFGVDPLGFSVALKVIDFKPSFYIRIKHKDPESTADLLLEKFNDALANENDPGDHIESISYVKKKRFVGASIAKDASGNAVLDASGNPVRKEYNLLKVVCANPFTYHKTVKAFEEDSEKWVIHDDFDISNQFLQQTGIQYQSWVEIMTAEYATQNKCTHCAIEASISMRDISSSEKTDIPRTLKCFLNVACVSRDATVDLNKHLFRPDPERMFDRTVVCCLTYVWSDSLVPVRQQVFSIIPGTDVIVCKTEQELYQKVQESLLSHDPDTILHFPDEINALSYISKRTQQFTVWERFKSVKMRMYNDMCQLKTRTLFDLRAPIRKKASVLIEAYDLHTVSCHRELRKKPETPSSFKYTPYSFPRLMRSAKTRGIIIEETKRDNDLLVALERDCNLRIEYANISKISNCGLYETVSRGEQIRVFNKLTDFTTKNGFFVNPKGLAKGPVRFPITEYPPTFPDPPEAEITTKLRLKSVEILNRKRKRMNEKPVKIVKTLHVDPFADTDSEEEQEEEDLAEGGNVVDPCPNMYEAPIPVLDFASLYPNIMRAFNISYENIVTNKKYLNIPGVKYTFVAINANETVAIVDSPGLMGNMLEMLISERSKVRKLADMEKDPFKKTNYTKQQESIKVICNATYGFCGAESKGSLLAMKAVMYMVTSLGRHLQKTVSKYLSDEYGMEGIYGDTDSVFPNPGIMNPKPEEMPNFTQAIAKKYRMNPSVLAEIDLNTSKGPKVGFFESGFTWENVVKYYATRFEPEDKHWRIDLTDKNLSPQILRNAVMFIVYKKLAHETSGLFRKEINLEFENMLDNLWMGWVKKHYFGRKWNPDQPHKPESYLKITGMASKKRDWCIFTRKVLNQIQEYLATDRSHLIRNCIVEAMNKLSRNEVPLDELKISCKYKGVMAYKNFNSKQMQIVLKMEKRHRCKIAEQTRIFYVILCGEEALCMRAETPEFASEHSLKPDIQYYLEKQFAKPVKKLLSFDPDLMDFDKEFKQVLARVTRSKTNTVDIADAGTKKRLRVEDLRSLPVKAKRIKTVQKPKNNPFGVSNSLED